MEGALGRTAVERFFGREAREIGIVVFLRKMCKDKVTRARVKSFRVGKIFADSVIREVPSARQNALLNDPRVRADFEHVQIVIRFEQQTICVAKMNFHKFRHVSKIGDERHLRTVGAEREANRIGSVVRNLKRVDIYVANRKMLASLNGFHAAQTLP